MITKQEIFKAKWLKRYDAFDEWITVTIPGWWERLTCFHSYCVKFGKDSKYGIKYNKKFAVPETDWYDSSYIVYCTKCGYSNTIEKDNIPAQQVEKDQLRYIENGEKNFYGR